MCGIGRGEAFGAIERHDTGCEGLQDRRHRGFGKHDGIYNAAAFAASSRMRLRRAADVGKLPAVYQKLRYLARHWRRPHAVREGEAEQGKRHHGHDAVPQKDAEAVFHAALLDAYDGIFQRFRCGIVD